MIKADPSNDHWLWPLEACRVAVDATIVQTPSLPARADELARGGAQGPE